MIIELNGTIVETIDERNMNEIMNKMNKVISSIYEGHDVVLEVMIDGMDATEDVEAYLSANINHFSNIVIHSVSREQLFLNLVHEMVDYLPRVQSSADSVSDLFYGEPSTEAWSKFAQLIDGLQWTMQSVQVLKVHLEQYEPNSSMYKSIINIIKKMETHLGELEQAVQAKDYVSMADMIKIENGDLIQELLAALESKVQA